MCSIERVIEFRLGPSGFVSGVETTVMTTDDLSGNRTGTFPKESAMSTMTIDTMMDQSRPAVRKPVYRLTRRGRGAVFLAGLMISLVAGIVLAGLAGATREAGPAVPTRVVTVHSGDTLWGIADGAAGQGSTQQMVDRLLDLNALESPMVTAGQKILVPRS